MTRSGREGGGEGARGAAAPVKKIMGDLAPPKSIFNCIQDTLIEQSRLRYFNRAVTVFSV